MGHITKEKLSNNDLIFRICECMFLIKLVNKRIG